jgi:hypothetical protein
MENKMGNEMGNEIKKQTDEELRQECTWDDNDLAMALKTIVTEGAQEAGISNFIFDDSFALQAAKKIRESAPSDAYFDIDAAVRQGVSEFLDMERNKDDKKSKSGVPIMSKENIENILKKLGGLTSFANMEQELAKVKDEVFRRILAKFMNEANKKTAKYIENLFIEIQNRQQLKDDLETQLASQMQELHGLKGKPAFKHKRTTAYITRQEIAKLEGTIALKKTMAAAADKSVVKDRSLKRYYRLENSGWRPEFGRIIKGIMGDLIKGKKIYKEVRISCDEAVDKFDSDLKVIERDQLGRSHKSTIYQNAKIARDVHSITTEQLKNKAWYKKLQEQGVTNLDDKMTELVDFINKMPETWKKFCYMYMLLDPPAEVISQGIGKSMMRPPEKGEIGRTDVQENYRQGLEASLDELEGEDKEELKKIMDTRKKSIFDEARRLVEGGSANPNWIIWLLLSTEFVSTEYGDTQVEQFEKTISKEDKRLLNMDDTKVEEQLNEDEKKRRNILINKLSVIGRLTILNGPKVISQLLWNKNIPDWVLMKIASLSRNPDIVTVAEKILGERGWKNKKEGKKNVYDVPKTKEEADLAEEEDSNSRLYQPSYSKVFERGASTERLSVRMAGSNSTALDQQIMQLETQLLALKKQKAAAMATEPKAQTTTLNSEPTSGLAGGAPGAGAAAPGGVSGGAKMNFNVIYKKAKRA